MRPCSVLFSLAVLCSAALTPPASAQAQVDAIVLRNPTHLTILYEVQWDLGKWHQYTLPPRKMMAHSIPAFGALPPVVRVKFDCLLIPGQFSEVIYKVNSKLVDNAFAGFRYAFAIQNGGSTLALVPDPPPVQVPVFRQSSVFFDLTNTSWKGSEYKTVKPGPLTLRFHPNGKVVMNRLMVVDITNGGETWGPMDLQGTWTQSGNQVSVTIPSANLALRGTVKGLSLVGTMRFSNEKLWNFSVSLQTK